MKAYTAILFGLCIMAGCTGKQGQTEEKATQKSDTTVVISDDNVITARWWDTGQGGTAPDIEARIEFVDGNGKQVVDERPLCKTALPQYDFSHREIRKIVSIETAYGEKAYLFYLFSKQGSDEYGLDLVALKIKDGKLVPADAFISDELSSPSHISLQPKHF